MRRFVFVLLALLFVFQPALAASQKKAAPRKPAAKKVAQNVRTNGQKIREMFPELIGSDDLVRAQNLRADAEGVPQIHRSDLTEEVLGTLLDMGQFLYLADLPNISIRKELWRKPNELYAWSWVVNQIADLAQYAADQVGVSLQYNSGTRPVEDQAWLTELVRKRVGRKVILVQRNQNAVPATGEKASLHTRAMASDFLAPRTLDAEIGISKYLVAKYYEGCLAATRELYQPVYHVVFFRTCSGAPLLEADQDGARMK